MTICPCCGSKSNGVLSDGCQACGSKPVGEPLPRPAHELPSYARSLVLTLSGTLMVLIFVTQTFAAIMQNWTRGAKSNLAALSMIPTSFWAWVAAAETAAWQLKWLMIPATLLVFFGARKIYRSLLAQPERFCGLRYARNGYFASAAVPFLVVILIGVTVPERLRQRQLGIVAGVNARSYRLARAQLEYQEKYGTLPSETKELYRLPDADGSLATALKDVDPAGYSVNSEVAAVPTKKPRPLRGAVIRNASFTAPDEPLSGGISFTNYELRLAGPDKLMNTEDDLILRDGVTYRPSELPRRGPTSVPPAR
ncbi:MAG: hypothetical protein QOD33_971 [Pyrinomonadaceae bacterium]|nr:hypothetical protein [Pyrinomonadaceae bacterium]